MNSGKSVELLKAAHNYEEGGKSVILMTSALDDREGFGKISSRIGLKRNAIPIRKGQDLYTYLAILCRGHEADCVLIDEVEFLDKEQIDQLAAIVDDFNVPILTYGLKNDFTNNLFEGSRELLIQADKIIEIKAICKYCNSKAVMNLRLDEFGNALGDGEQVVIGGNDQYISVCRQHYNEKLGITVGGNERVKQ